MQPSRWKYIGQAIEVVAFFALIAFAIGCCHDLAMHPAGG